MRLLTRPTSRKCSTTIRQLQIPYSCGPVARDVPLKVKFMLDLAWFARRCHFTLLGDSPHTPRLAAPEFAERINNVHKFSKYCCSMYNILHKVHEYYTKLIKRKSLLGLFCGTGGRARAASAVVGTHFSNYQRCIYYGVSALYSCPPSQRNEIFMWGTRQAILSAVIRNWWMPRAAPRRTLSDYSRPQPSRNMITTRSNIKQNNSM